MVRTLTLLALLPAMAGSARAETVELGAAVLAASETSSPESGGHLGGALTLALWSDRLGLVLETGRAQWNPEAVTWVGIGGRLGLLESFRHCPRRPYTGDPPTCFEFRPWIGAGLLHEKWAWETYFGDDTGRFERNAYYVGGGFDTNMTPLASTVFFRVQRGKVPQDVPVMDMHDAPYETSLVFGFGLGYAGN